jgi:hypothetical protein
MEDKNVGSIQAEEPNNDDKRIEKTKEDFKNVMSAIVEKPNFFGKTINNVFGDASQDVRATCVGCWGVLTEEGFCEGSCDLESSKICPANNCMVKIDMDIPTCTKHVNMVCKKCNNNLLSYDNVCIMCDNDLKHCGVKTCGVLVHFYYKLCREHWNNNRICRKCFALNCNRCHQCDGLLSTNGWCLECHGPFDRCNIRHCVQTKPYNLPMCREHHRSRRFCKHCLRPYNAKNGRTGRRYYEFVCDSCDEIRKCRWGGCKTFISYRKRNCLKHANMLRMQQ